MGLPYLEKAQALYNKYMKEEKAEKKTYYDLPSVLTQDKGKLEKNHTLTLFYMA